MKKLIAFLLFMTPLFLLAQSEDQKQVSKSLDQYFQYNMDRNLDGILDMVNPKLYNLISRDQMKQTFEATFNNPQFSIDMTDFKSGDISEIFELNGEKFAVADYSHGMAFNFNEADSMMTSAMMQAFSAQNGASDVKLSDDGKVLSASMKKTLWAYQPEGDDAWYFNDYDPSNKMMMTQLIPEEAINHFFPE